MTESLHIKSITSKVKDLSDIEREVCAIRNYLGLSGEQLLDSPLKRKMTEGPEKSFILYFRLNWKDFDDIAKFFLLDKQQQISAKFRAELVLALRARLRKLGLTHEEAAERVKISRSTLTSIVGGKLESVSIDRLLDVCLKLDVKLQYQVHA